MPEYPAPSVPYSGHSDLYFATERQVRSPLAVGNYDRGELSLAPGRVTFRGMRVEVDCPQVTSVRLVRKAFPWGLVVAVGGVAAPLGYLAAPDTFTWRHPLPYMLLGILAVASLRQAREQWVEVVYAGPEGERRAYFRREPTWIGSGAARTRQLCEAIRSQTLGAGDRE
jgi:hypothetical protein